MISAGLYLMLMGNTGVPGGVSSIEGEKRRIPRPFVGVHSGNKAIVRLGFSARSCETGTSVAFVGGFMSGGEKARMRAGRRLRRSTSLWLGYEAVKMGSKLEKWGKGEDQQFGIDVYAWESAYTAAR